MKCMIFAAGLGTRLKPLTDTMPKAMVPVGGRPLVDLTISRLLAAGATEIVINVHHFGEQITDYVTRKDWGVKIRISDERHELLDTGGGLLQAAGLFSEDDSPILIHNVDILSNADLEKFYLNGFSHDATLLVSERETQRYLLFDDDMRLRGWTNLRTGETKSPYPDFDPDKLHRYAFSGIQAISPHLTQKMKEFGRKFPIMDFYLSHCAKADIRGFLQRDLKLLDVGKLDSLRQAEEWLLRS